ncbi:PQQ-binding-like beta-propeller repeat protein [Pseudomaricurvus alkylphenolicus]|uniref:outer membrane protein assembly factor BamB family protein n=1 Tax=Pseudomaricurvus alkylphenolicus TaxID=1306991 RepID=UPI0014246EB5|nr:PQQ-binding-like beta-propeller repeat protein [Pseudomaricurvus alkylphenolicus]NIB43544.1 PQQ-binding-like beta-propeller repeat protein [Pseudomaricurvus alkylphenolicus]
MTIWARTSLLAAIALFGQSVSGSADTQAIANGQAQFNIYCAACHRGASPEAPRVEALKLYPPGRIVAALEDGVMSTQGIPLSRKDKLDVALFLTGKTVSEKKTDLSQSMCSAKGVATPKHPSDILWNGWGGDSRNLRHASDHQGIATTNVANLKLKWAFGFPNATRARAQPVVTPEMTYVGSQDGTVYALDTQTGCIHWAFRAESEVRGAIQITRDETGKPATLIFGDFKANAYAVDIASGSLLWKVKAHAHPMASITGSLAVYNNTAYVPVSSSEVIAAARPDYSCCSFRGALVAIDRNTGAIIWQTNTTDKPRPTKKSSAGVQLYGPSGAPIWSSPTVDAKRNLIYVTTGQNYSSPATNTSDAVIALDANTGAIRWSTQVTTNDAWNGACVRKTANCPDEDGPDFDIGTSAMLVTSNKHEGRSKDVIVIGQKSGMVYALDADANGRILWKRRVGRGGTMGGVHWGLSSNGSDVFVGVSDLKTNNSYTVGPARPGINSLNLLTGAFNWRRMLPDVCKKDIAFVCYSGVSAAVSSSAGVVYAGGLDGMLRAFDAHSGNILWESDTNRYFATANGISAKGGAIESDGPVIAGNQLFITSGYDKWGEIPGNVLLVYSIDGQ